MRAWLEDKGSDRYAMLASLLGLEEVYEFVRSATKRYDRIGAAATKARADADQAAQARVRAETELAQLRDNAARAGDLHILWQRVTDALESVSDTVRLAHVPPPSLGAAEILIATTARLGERLRALGDDVERHEGLGMADDPAVLEGAIVVLETTRRVALDVAAADTVRLDQMKLEFDGAVALRSTLVKVLEMSQELLSERCPVCEQAIQPEEVLGRLHERLGVEHLDGQLAEHQLGAMRAERDAAVALATTCAQELAEVENRLARAGQWRTEHATLARRGMEILAEFAEAGIEPVHASEIAGLDARHIHGAVEALRHWWRVLSEFIAVSRTLDVHGKIIAAEAATSRARRLAHEAAERAGEASRLEADADALRKAATRAGASVAGVRFAALKPYIDEIFARLSSHPAFDHLDLSVDVYRERGVAHPMVLDSESGVLADPLLVLNSSHSNVVALSCFLALGWAAGEEAVPFVMLDDPLQSLDDVNALAFADLCRQMRDERQLIIATHDRRLASLLERKLAPRSDDEATVINEFVGWSRSGPTVRGRFVESQAAVGRSRVVGISAA